LVFLDACGVAALVKVGQLAARLGRPIVARHAHGEVDTVLRVTGLAESFGLPALPAPARLDFGVDVT
jgi:hypothetical protein